MGDDQQEAETAAEAETVEAVEEAPVEEAAPDLETRVTDLEAAIIALGGADRVPTL